MQPFPLSHFSLPKVRLVPKPKAGDYTNKSLLIPVLYNVTRELIPMIKKGGTFSPPSLPSWAFPSLRLIIIIDVTRYHHWENCFSVRYAVFNVSSISDTHAYTLSMYAFVCLFACLSAFFLLFFYLHACVAENRKKRIVIRKKVNK